MTEPRVMRDAIKALRETSGHTHDPNITRRRIVGTVTRRKRQRRQTIALLLIAFVGLPLGTTAYAAFFGTPAFVQAWLDRDLNLTPRVVANVDRPLSTRRGEGQVTPTTVHASNVAPATIVASDTHATRDATTAVPLATRGEGNRAPRKIDRGEVRGAVRGEDDTLYTRAHELHFVTRDPAAALAAWNAYIDQTRSAALLPEAKYNRALCLVRLHRNSEAIGALTPFADGTHGTYRKREATALLRALTQ